MRNTILIILVTFFFFGCCPGDSVTIDNGHLPEKAFGFIPYQDGRIYKFKHSGGLIINYTTRRETREEWNHCEECCKYVYKYEVDATTLTPDYPVFDFGFEISNMDTTYFIFTARVGYYQFYIPTNHNQSEYYELFDSVLISNKFYHDVFKLKSNYGSYYDKDSIFADSLYYSYERGILQIKMTNGEKYTIYE